MSERIPEVFPDVALFVTPSSRYTVLGASQSEVNDAGGDMVDSVEVTFAVTGRPGVFTVEIALDDPMPTEVQFSLDSEADEIEALYAL